MRPMVALSVLAAAFVYDASRGARAQWCAYYDEFTYTCGFRTFQQCLQTISGVGGICRRDWQAQPTERPRARTRKNPGSQRSR